MNLKGSCHCSEYADELSTTWWTSFGMSNSPQINASPHPCSFPLEATSSPIYPCSSAVLTSSFLSTDLSQYYRWHTFRGLFHHRMYVAEFRTANAHVAISSSITKMPWTTCEIHWGMNHVVWAREKVFESPSPLLLSRISASDIRILITLGTWSASRTVGGSLSWCCMKLPIREKNLCVFVQRYSRLHVIIRYASYAINMINPTFVVLSDLACYYQLPCCPCDNKFRQKQCQHHCAHTMYASPTPTVIWCWDIRLNHETDTGKSGHGAAPDNIPKGSASMKIIACGWFRANGEETFEMVSGVGITMVVYLLLVLGIENMRLNKCLWFPHQQHLHVKCHC